MTFKQPASISEIIEHSRREPVIIFKYSSECGTSSELARGLEKAVEKKAIPCPIYQITVQIKPTLSANIAEYFDITHETPQIIILRNARVTYTAHHRNIKIRNFSFE